MLNQSIWALPDELTNSIITTFFKQERADTSALVKGRLPGGQVYTWLFTADRYYPISRSDYDKFRQAAKSRGGDYTLELCEFEIEDYSDDGDIVLNYWRHFADDSGEGGRVVLVHKQNTWTLAKRLKGWQKPDPKTDSSDVSL